MSAAEDIARDFKALYSNIESASQVAVNKATAVTRDYLRMHSPVKTGRYQKNWRLSRAKSSAGVFAEASVFNATSYGYWIEEGADDPSKVPHWGLGPKTTDGKRSYFGSSSRFWSTTALGGVIRPFLLSNGGNSVLNNLADDVIKGIKW